MSNSHHLDMKQATKLFHDLLKHTGDNARLCLGDLSNGNIDPPYNDAAYTCEALGVPLPDTICLCDKIPKNIREATTNVSNGGCFVGESEISPEDVAVLYEGGQFALDITPSDDFKTIDSGYVRVGAVLQGGVLLCSTPINNEPYVGSGDTVSVSQFMIQMPNQVRPLCFEDRLIRLNKNIGIEVDYGSSMTGNGMC